jgi:formate transporter
MDYVSPAEVSNSMLNTAITKASLPVRDLLVRGILSGALLAISVTLAFAAITQTKLPLAGAIVFPVGFVMIVILGLELVTGSFALIPLAWFERQISAKQMLKNLFWVFAGNLAGSLIYAFLYWAATSEFGTSTAPGPIEQMLVAAAERKTIGYANHGLAGFAAQFVKAVLCNWMVCMGVILPMASKSTAGKVLSAAIPIFIFFALGYEHAVVNMFVIPAGIFFGAKITVGDWWLYNQLLVTAGNIVGGLLFTGVAIYYTHRKRQTNNLAELTKAA